MSSENNGPQNAASLVLAYHLAENLSRSPLNRHHYSPVVLTQLSYLMLGPGHEVSHEADQLH